MTSTSYVGVHEAKTGVDTSRPVADQEQITPGERVALSVTGGGVAAVEGVDYR